MRNRLKNAASGCLCFVAVVLAAVVCGDVHE